MNLIYVPQASAAPSPAASTPLLISPGAAIDLVLARHRVYRLPRFISSSRSVASSPPDPRHPTGRVRYTEGGGGRTRANTRARSYSSVPCLVRSCIRSFRGDLHFLLHAAPLFSVRHRVVSLPIGNPIHHLPGSPTPRFSVSRQGTGTHSIRWRLLSRTTGGSFVLVIFPANMKQPGLRGARLTEDKHDRETGFRDSSGHHPQRVRVLRPAAKSSPFRTRPASLYPPNDRAKPSYAGIPLFSTAATVKPPFLLGRSRRGATPRFLDQHPRW